MTEVIVAGIGQMPVGDHWDRSLRGMAAQVMKEAIADAGGLKPDAVYVGNLLASQLSHQSNLGALLATELNLRGAEAVTVEAAEASGAGAFRMGYMAVKSGLIDAALVVGVEKYTDVPDEAEAVVAQVADYDWDVIQRVTPKTQAALLMQRYLHEYRVPEHALAGFAVQAHANAVNNPNAYFRRAITKESYAKAGMISTPLNMFDMAPYADGAAAVLLTRSDLLPGDYAHPKVRVLGSSVVIDTLSLHDRPTPLAFQAAGISVQRACSQAGILPADADLFEISDLFSVYAVLALEAAGFAEHGQAWKLAMDGDLALDGKLPISTMGGCKGRGNPLGATGVYQLVEATQQLRGAAGNNQIPDARLALVQSLGGPASTAVTHVLETWQNG
jgi:acetyl-CoA C-acetyltransferase